MIMDRRTQRQGAQTAAALGLDIFFPCCDGRYRNALRHVLPNTRCASLTARSPDGQSPVENEAETSWPRIEKTWKIECELNCWSYGNVLSLPSPASAGMGWWITTTLTDGIAAPVDSGFRVWAHEFYEPGRKRWRGEEEPDTRLSRMEAEWVSKHLINKTGFSSSRARAHGTRPLPSSLR